MKKCKGFTLVEIMIVVAIIALIAAIGIPNLVRAKIQANEDNAIANLRAVAVASENYTNDFAGNYPVNMTSLTSGSTPYLDLQYNLCDQTSQGYTFGCYQVSTGYLLSATPVEAGVTGNKIFAMSTGVVLTEAIASPDPVKADITDTAFQDCLTAIVGASSWAEVTQEDLESIAGLFAGGDHCDNSGITDASGLGVLVNLNTLSFQNNNLSELPAEIQYLEGVTSLALSGNNLSELPSEIGLLDDLRSMNISSNDLDTLPPEIGNLKSLSTLYLGNNDISSLPNEIGGLESLNLLNLGGNNLTSLPSEIGDLSDLSSFYLQNNQLTSLPDELGNLENLQTLFLRNNWSLSSMPTASGGGIHLQILDVRNTGVTCASAATAGWTADNCYE